jgi:hypothetical protein
MALQQLGFKSHTSKKTHRQTFTCACGAGPFSRYRANKHADECPICKQARNLLLLVPTPQVRGFIHRRVGVRICGIIWAVRHMAVRLQTHSCGRLCRMNVAAL